MALAGLALLQRASSVGPEARAALAGQLLPWAACRAAVHGMELVGRPTQISTEHQHHAVHVAQHQFLDCPYWLVDRSQAARASVTPCSYVD